MNSILGFIIRTYKKVGFGSLRYIMNPKPGTLNPILRRKLSISTVPKIMYNWSSRIN